MEILIGLIIIAIGAFCQSSSYVPINKIKDWSWESYWIVQGLFAWLILPFLGALLAVPEGRSLFELFTDQNAFNVGMTILFGVLWGVGGLTFGLSMRYLAWRWDRALPWAPVPDWAPSSAPCSSTSSSPSRIRFPNSPLPSSLAWW